MAEPARERCVHDLGGSQTGRSTMQALAQSLRCHCPGQSQRPRRHRQTARWKEQQCKLWRRFAGFKVQEARAHTHCRSRGRATRYAARSSRVEGSPVVGVLSVETVGQLIHLGLAAEDEGGIEKHRDSAWAPQLSSGMTASTFCDFGVLKEENGKRTGWLPQRRAAAVQRAPSCLRVCASRAMSDCRSQYGARKSAAAPQARNTIWGTPEGGDMQAAVFSEELAGETSQLVGHHADKDR